MDPELFGVAIGANSVVSVMALIALIAIPSIAIIRRFIPSNTIDEVNTIAMVEQEVAIAQRFRLTHISFAIGLSFMLCALSYALAVVLGMEQYGILFVTALAVLLASVVPGPLAKLECDFELGMLMMYLFFAAVGLSTNVTAFIDSALNLFFYCLVLMALHLLLVLLTAKVFRFDLAGQLHRRNHHQFSGVRKDEHRVTGGFRPAKSGDSYRRRLGHWQSLSIEICAGGLGGRGSGPERKSCGSHLQTDRTAWWRSHCAGGRYYI